MFQRLARLTLSFAHASAQTRSVALILSTNCVVQIGLQLGSDQRSLRSFRRLRADDFNGALRANQVTILVGRRLH